MPSQFYIIYKTSSPSSSLYTIIGLIGFFCRSGVWGSTTWLINPRAKPGIFSGPFTKQCINIPLPMHPTKTSPNRTLRTSPADFKTDQSEESALGAQYRATPQTQTYKHQSQHISHEWRQEGTSKKKKNEKKKTPDLPSSPRRLGSSQSRDKLVNPPRRA